MTADDKRPVGRPPIGPEVKVRLPEEMLKAVDSWSKIHGQTRAETIREAIDAFF